MSSRLSVAAAVLLVGSSFAASSAPSPPAAPFAIHDLTPEFWRFWEAAQNQPVEQQEKLWQQLYVAPHKAVFDDLAGPCKAVYEPAWARARFFPGLPGVVPQIREMVAGLARQLDEANGRFLKTFPDMRWSGDVYVMVSGFCFNGRAQMIQGRSALLFGVDAAVGLGQKDLIPVMQHELFHRYHRDYFEFEGSSGYPLWATLWAEGMATYVSELLNPSASDTDLGNVPLGMVQQVDNRRDELAAAFLQRFESTSEKDATVWFNDIHSKDPLVPPRGGYQLGALVARELSKQDSIQTMAHWSQVEAKPRVRAALERISVTPQSRPDATNTKANSGQGRPVSRDAPRE